MPIDSPSKVAGESAARALATGDARWYEPLLDLLPVPLVLVAPRTGQVVFANQAAHRAAGGRSPSRVTPPSIPASTASATPPGAR